MTSIFHNPLDNSFWRSMPPTGGRELPPDEAAVVEAALALGHLPRFEAGAWKFYTPGDPPADVLMHTLRHQRDSLLRACDWTQMPDAEIDPRQRQAWVDYRRALRALPQTHPDGRVTAWPTPPI